MKKVLFVLCMNLLLVGCGSKTQPPSSSGDSTVNVIVPESESSAETAEVQEAEPENILIKISRPAHEFNRNAYEIELRLLADGAVNFQVTTLEPKNYPEPDEDPYYRETITQEGSWKEIEVKRGTKFLIAYEIGITSGELYCTEKFDYLWGIGDETPYSHFSEGQTGYAWKITSVEKY